MDDKGRTGTGETTFASRVAAMMRARDVELVSRARIGTGLVSRGGRIFVVSYDEGSEEEREILTEEALASFLASADSDPWGYTATVVGQARDAVAAANQTAIVRGWLAPPRARDRARPFASVEGADEAVRDRVVDAVVKATA